MLPLAPSVAVDPAGLVSVPAERKSWPPPWKSIPPLAVVVATASVPADQLNKPLSERVPVPLIVPLVNDKVVALRLLVPKLAVPPDTENPPPVKLVIVPLKVTFPPVKVVVPVML